MKRTKEAAEITRQQILKAALRVFSSKGYSDTRLEDVAQEAGVTRGAIYWHFENKEDLYLQFTEQLFEKYQRQIHQALAIDGSPLTKIRNLLKELFIMLEDDEEFRANYTMSLFGTTMTNKMRDQLNRFVAFMGKLGQTLGNLIQEGIEAGEVDPATNPFVAAVALVSYINGVETTWLGAPEAFSVKRIAGDLADFPLGGIMNE